MRVQPALTSDTRNTKDSILFNEEQRKKIKKLFGVSDEVGYPTI